MALQRRLTGQRDSRGPVGMLARGKNVYNSTSLAAHSGGGPQFGRPPLQQKNVQPNLRQEMPSPQEGGGLIDMNPQPVNLLGAIQRRLQGGQRGSYS